MLYGLLVTLVTAYSAFSVLFLVWHLFNLKVRGAEGYATLLNEKFAGKRSMLAFQVGSYLILGCWMVLVLPWVDLFTIQKFAQFTHDATGTGFMTWFGHMSSATATTYFMFVFLNILGVKGGLNLIDAARMLGRGRVRLIPVKFAGLVWVQE